MQSGTSVRPSTKSLTETLKCYTTLQQFYAQCTWPAITEKSFESSYSTFLYKIIVTVWLSASFPFVMQVSQCYC